MQTQDPLFILALLLCFTAVVVTTPASGPEAEATSLLGKELRPPAPPPTFAAEQEKTIEALRARLREDPADPDALLWLGRRLGYLGRYREAVTVFTEGAARYPGDARFLRHRGHRHLTLRRLDDAIADFERGLALVAGHPDVVEPDGLPNLFNQPTSTLKTNLWYHLGLARYLKADFLRAGEAFHACAALADNPNMWVAAIYWQVLSLRRQGREDESKEALAGLPADTRVIENEDYLRLLRLFRGETTVEELLSADGEGIAGATVGYGIGAWHLVEGRAEAARKSFEQVVAGDAWAAFGHLAAEAELARGVR